MNEFISKWLGRWANLHPVIRFGVLASLLALLGFAGGKPAYRAFREWRMGRNLAAARTAVEGTRMQEARDLSLTVLRSGDPCIEAFRILEKATASLRDPLHGEISRALISHPESTIEDRLTGFRGMAAGMPLGVVGQGWVALPDECRKDPRFARAFAERLVPEGRTGEAASVLLGVPAEKRDEGISRALVKVLVKTGGGEALAEAQRMIARGFPQAGGETGPWLDLLESLPVASLNVGILGGVRARLQDPGEGDAARKALILVRMDYASRFPDRAAILESAIKSWKDRGPLELARFLAHLGLDQLMLDTFADSKVSEIPALLPLMIEAARRTYSWDRFRVLLENHGSLLPRLEALAQRAVLAAKAEDSAARTEAWTAAMSEATGSDSGDSYLTLHRIARAAEMQREADDALYAAVRRGRGALPLYDSLKPLMQSLAAQGQESQLLQICAVYLAFEPGNPSLLTQYAYLACLNELAEPKVILQVLEPLAKAFPKELPIQCALATGYLCDSRPKDAAEVLDPLDLDPEKLPPSFRVVVLATRVLNGTLAASDPLVADFPWKALLPSERKRFGIMIRGAES